MLKVINIFLNSLLLNFIRNEKDRQNCQKINKIECVKNKILFIFGIEETPEIIDRKENGKNYFKNFDDIHSKRN